MSTRDLAGEFDDLVRLSFFVEIGKAISKARTIGETIDEVMRQIGEIFAPRNWSLLLKDTRTGDLIFTLVVGTSARKLKGQRLSRGEGIAGWIAETGQAVIIEDVAKDPRFCRRIDTATGFSTTSIIGVPLKTNGKVFGVIELINKLDEKAFTAFELKVLSTIADFAALAIEKAYYLRALSKLATIDALTGVANRGEFDRLVARELARSKRYATPLSCLMVDIDGFKKINDSFGHPAGDCVLKALASILQRTVRQVDTVCRYGGDEFVLVMPGIGKAQAVEARDRVLAALADYNAAGPRIPLVVSIGLHTVVGGETDAFFDTLDQDLYREKERKLLRTITDMDDNLEAMLAEEVREQTSRGDGD